jgi:hypothetical protein
VNCPSKVSNLVTTSAITCSSAFSLDSNDIYPFGKVHGPLRKSINLMLQVFNRGSAKAFASRKKIG